VWDSGKCDLGVSGRVEEKSGLPDSRKAFVACWLPSAESWSQAVNFTWLEIRE
jgi:hypothetical protein